MVHANGGIAAGQSVVMQKAYHEVASSFKQPCYISQPTNTPRR
jgi:hypothetical protein